MAAWNMKLAGKRGHPLPRHHPLYCRKLELSAEHTALALGHRSLLENCPLFLCLILGVHSSAVHGPSLVKNNESTRPGPAVHPDGETRVSTGGADNAVRHWQSLKQRGRPRAAVQPAFCPTWVPEWPLMQT